MMSTCEATQMMRTNGLLLLVTLKVVDVSGWRYANKLFKFFNEVRLIKIV